MTLHVFCVNIPLTQEEKAGLGEKKRLAWIRTILDSFKEQCAFFFGQGTMGQVFHPCKTLTVTVQITQVLYTRLKNWSLGGSCESMGCPGHDAMSDVMIMTK